MCISPGQLASAAWMLALKAYAAMSMGPSCLKSVQHMHVDTLCIVASYLPPLPRVAPVRTAVKTRESSLAVSPGPSELC